MQKETKGIFNITLPEREAEKKINFSKLNRAQRRKFGKLYGGIKIKGANVPLHY